MDVTPPTQIAGVIFDAWHFLHIEIRFELWPDLI